MDKLSNDTNNISVNKSNVNMMINMIQSIINNLYVL